MVDVWGEEGHVCVCVWCERACVHMCVLASAYVRASAHACVFVCSRARAPNEEEVSVCVYRYHCYKCPGRCET